MFASQVAAHISPQAWSRRIGEQLLVLQGSMGDLHVDAFVVVRERTQTS